MNHTPTPWIYLPEISATRLESKDGIVIAILNDTHKDFVKVPYKDNAARIVACVNACEGMKDPEAEIAKLRELAVEVNILEKDGEVQAVGLKPVNVHEYTSKDTRIAQLEARVKELEDAFPRKVYVITEDTGGAYSECKDTLAVFVSEDKAFEFCRGKHGRTYDEFVLTK